MECVYGGGGAENIMGKGQNGWLPAFFQATSILSLSAMCLKTFFLDVCKPQDYSHAQQLKCLFCGHENFPAFPRFYLSPFQKNYLSQNYIVDVSKLDGYKVSLAGKVFMQNRHHNRYQCLAVAAFYRNPFPNKPRF